VTTSLSWLRHLIRSVDWFYGKSRNLIERLVSTIEQATYSPPLANPNSPGYLPHRNRAISKALDQACFTPGSLPVGFGAFLDERVVEYSWLFSRLPREPMKILDAGSVLNLDFIIRRNELKNKKLTVATLSPEPECHWWRNISYTYEDLRNASFRDSYFDAVICLSTLEHVGMDTSAYTGQAEMSDALSRGQWRTFIQELHRVLKPGGTLFLSVPVGKRSDLEWLQVFDAQGVEEIAGVFAPRIRKDHFFRYTPSGWAASSADKVAGAGYAQTATFQPVIAAEAIACLEWVK
jgi:SAM-dependent methyltransferase